MSQPDLFTPDEAVVARSAIARARAVLNGTEPPPSVEAATAARDEGMAQADENAPEAWKLEAYEFLLEYLRTHLTMFCDDLWDAGMPKPPNPKALGPLILKAAKNGVMCKTGEYRQSVSSHLIPKVIWKSLIYEGEQ